MMSTAYPGPVCESAGLTSSVLLAAVGAKPKRLPKLPIHAITNGMVFELEIFRQKTATAQKCDVLRTWVMGLMPGTDLKPTASAFRYAVKRVIHQRQRLMKTRGEAIALQQFLQQPFQMPCTTSPAQPVTHTAEPSSSDDSEEQLSSLRLEAELAKKTSEELLAEAEKWKSRYDRECQRLQGRYNPHNVRRREKRRDAQLAEKDRLLCGLKKELKVARHQEAKKSSMKAAYYKRKIQEVQAASVEEPCAECTQLNKKLAKLQEEIAELHEMNAQLQEQVNALQKEKESGQVDTYTGGRYTNELRECIMHLLTLNVGINNINKVVECVLKLAGKKCSKLPSRSKINDLLAEARAISHLQVAEELTKPSSKDSTLHTDGTTKFGHKYLGYQVVTEEQSFTLGVREVVRGSAQATLDEMATILQELTNIACSQTCSDVGNKILSNIKSTMSDRASVERSFNELLTEYRATILPTVVEGWSDLLEEEQLSMSRMYNFFCGMHLIVSMAEHTAEALKLFENSHFEGKPAGSATISGIGAWGSSEAGTLRLIRTACKAFERRGDEKSGCPLQFASFLKSKGICKVPLAHFKGNRFNIIFRNGGAVFYLHKHIKEFLVSTLGVPNNLLKAVLADTKETLYIAGCKALGLIDHFITSPLWRLLESDVHILDMCTHYTELHSFLCRATLDASSFMSRDDVPFPNVHIKEGNILEALLVPNPDLDDLAQEMLQAIFQTLSLLIERVVSDYLPGGEWDMAMGDAKIKTKTKSVQKTNTISERDFGKLDRYIREKPNARLLALEAHILFTTNKTAKWLDSKSVDEKENLFAMARKASPQHQRAFRERQKAIQEQRQEALRLKQVEMERKQQRALQRKEKCTSELIEYGLWQSIEEVDALLMPLTRTQRVTALKVQLRFRKSVLQQVHPDKTIFQFSDKSSGTYSPDKLRENLAKLIQAAQSECGSRDSCTREVEAESVLVGKRILHDFIEDDAVVQYTGTVLSQVPGFPEWYNTVYDDEPDCVYTFQLLDDYNSGDLKIL